MAKSTTTPVDAKTIRLAFAAGEFAVTDAALTSLSPSARGRLHPEAVEAFEATHPGQVYAGPHRKSEPTVTLPVTRKSKSGATLKRPVTVPRSQVRALAGVMGKRGRLSAADISRATAAYMAK